MLEAELLECLTHFILGSRREPHNDKLVGWHVFRNDPPLAVGNLAGIHVDRHKIALLVTCHNALLCNRS